jgi:hypothetical protein
MVLLISKTGLQTLFWELLLTMKQLKLHQWRSRWDLLPPGKTEWRLSYTFAYITSWCSCSFRWFTE